MEIRQQYKINVDLENRTVGFWEDDYFLSSVYAGAPFVIEGDFYDSVERYYQRMRFINTIPRIATKIMETDEQCRFVLSTVDCASLGSEYEVLQDPDWDSLKDDVMETAIRTKVDQNPKIQRLLLLSKSWYLYEDIHADFQHEEKLPYWGLMNGQGINKNGEILMKIRLELLFNRNYQDCGVINRSDESTYQGFIESLGLGKEADVSWFDIYSAIILRRAETYGFKEGLFPWEALLQLERRFQEEALISPMLKKGVRKNDSYETKWRKIAGSYKTWYEELPVEQQGLEDLRRKTAMFLEMNKFTCTWEDINRELEELGLNPFVVEA